jgi:glycosyltransferase involved in cell wall biosynthesis
MVHNRFTIIIPALNEEEFIGECLASIEKLNYPKNLVEVIVVDNGSQDQTITIAKRHNVKVISHQDCNVSQLRNLGAKNASHEILAFVDADCRVPIHWLLDAQICLNRPGVGAVGCWYRLPRGNTTWVDAVWDIHMMSRRNKIGNVGWVPSGNFIISKDIFNKVKGFDESLITSEDVDICGRIQKAGFTIYSHPKLAIEHLGEPHSIAKYFKKETWRGKGVFQNFLRYLPQVKLNKALILAFLTLFLCMGTVVGVGVEIFAGHMQIFISCLIILLSIPLILSVKTLTTKRRQWKYFLPLAFLFLLYSMARAASICEPKLWTTAQNHRSR